MTRKTLESALESYRDRPQVGDKCPKCQSNYDEATGEHAWDVRYVPSDDDIRAFVGATSRSVFYDNRPSIDYLEWTCHRCGYSVMTECADKVASEVVPA